MLNFGGSTGEIRLRGDQGIHHKESEHGRAVHYKETDSGPL